MEKNKIAEIAGVVAEFYDVEVGLMQSQYRHHEIARARHVAIALCAAFNEKHLEIANWFNRERSLVSYCSKQILDKKQCYPRFAKEIKEIVKRIR